MRLVMMSCILAALPVLAFGQFGGAGSLGSQPTFNGTRVGGQSGSRGLAPFGLPTSTSRPLSRPGITVPGQGSRGPRLGVPVGVSTSRPGGRAGTRGGRSSGCRRLVESAKSVSGDAESK